MHAHLWVEDPSSGKKRKWLRTDNLFEIERKSLLRMEKPIVSKGPAIKRVPHAHQTGTGLQKVVNLHSTAESRTGPARTGRSRIKAMEKVRE